jgi:hypothetical protein
MVEIAVVHELPLAAAAGLEVEGAPRDQGRLVRESRELEIRFGVKFRHV